MKKSKIIILTAFILNLLSLLAMLSPMKAFLSILNGFSGQQVALSLIAPILQGIITITALALWFYFHNKEKENQTVKFANIVGYIFIILAPVLFFTSYLVSAYFIYNLASFPTPTNQTSNNDTGISGIKTLSPNDVQDLINTPIGWQTLTNNKFNYQIAYPTNLKTGEYCMGGEVQNGVTVPSDYEFSCNLNVVNTGSDYMIMVVNDLNVNGNFSIPGTDFTPTMRLGEARPDYALEDITTNLTKNGYQQLSSTTIDGLSVVRFTYNSKAYGKHDFWYFVKNGNLYFNELTPSEHANDLRTQILNTLKFK